MQRLVVSALTLFVALAGCAGPAEPSQSPAGPSSAASPTASTPAISPSASASPTPPASTAATPGTIETEPSGVVIHVALTNGKSVPNGQRVNVKLGQSVTLYVRSDHDDQVHIHGYDHEFDVKSGKPTVWKFHAEIAGRFEIESHSPANLIVTLIVS